MNVLDTVFKLYIERLSHLKTKSDYFIKFLYPTVLQARVGCEGLRLLLGKHVRPAPLKKNHAISVDPKLKNHTLSERPTVKITLSDTILFIIFVKKIPFFTILPI